MASPAKAADSAESADAAPVSLRSTVAVVGAGPAGLAAAVEAARAGLHVTLVDAGSHLGGQFWRQGPAGLAADPSRHHDVHVFSELARQANEFIGRGLLVHLARHHVWSLSMNDGVDATGGTLFAVDRSDSSRPSEAAVSWQYLILAAGAFDRQLPFPGWDLPGVLTVGAAQSLLKGSAVVVGPRVLVAGTGPFLLPVATALAARGADVVGVYEANDPKAWLGHLPVLLANRRRIREAVGYYAALVRYRVRLHHRSIVVAAHGDDRLDAVTVARLDRHGRRKPGRDRRVSVDVLAVGYGFSTQPELPVAAGCRMRVVDDTLVVDTDDNQATSHPRVFAAGEITGIGGAQLAVAEGIIAGAAVARAAGPAGPRGADSVRPPAARPDQLRRFAKAMHAVYPVPTAWIESLEPDTIVCRCEEVTVAEIDAAIGLGARDNRTVKLFSRAGMGWCQGRECSYATACLTAQRTGSALNLASGAERPVATPIPLGLVADSIA